MKFTPGGEAIWHTPRKKYFQFKSTKLRGKSVCENNVITLKKDVWTEKAITPKILALKFSLNFKAMHYFILKGNITFFSLDLCVPHSCKTLIFIFIFDFFGASQKLYRNLWYIKSPLWKVISLPLGWFIISAQVAKKSIFWLPKINKYLTSMDLKLLCLVSLSFMNLSLK